MRILATAALIVLGVGAFALLLVLALGLYVTIAAFAFAGAVGAIVGVQLAGHALRDWLWQAARDGFAARRYWRRA